MFRILKISLIAILLAGSVPAQADTADIAATKDKLWGAVTEGDYASVEAILANAQLQYLAGEAGAEDMRALLGLFYANNPDLIAFTEGWLEVYPKSAYAHTAQAWLFHRMSWDIRGNGRARDIYPKAIADFRDMQRFAWVQATEAYDLDNRLLPASDAMIRLANSVGEQRRALKTLRGVMKTDPNMGTLRRSMGLTSGGWGFAGATWDTAEEICKRYGPMIDWDEGDPVTYCLLYAAGTIHRGDHFEWAYDILATGEFPSLDYLRLNRSTRSDSTRAQAEFAREYLSRDDVTDVKHAREYDLNVAPKHNFDFLGEAHQRRAREQALEAIKRDPYNPELIKTLQNSITRMTPTETSLMSKVIESPTHEERIEYARRMLVASPYNAQHWRAYGQELYPQSAENALKDEGFRINAVVYSDHAPGYLMGYAFDKWRLLSALERLDTETQSAVFQKLDDARKAKSRKQIKEWQAVRENMDLDRDLRCPMIRAHRLYELVCESSQDPECEPIPEQAEMIAIVRADVNRRRVCTGVIAAPAHELFYSPIPIDLSAPEG